MWSPRCSIEQVKEIRKQSPALTFLSCLVHTWCGPTIITSHGCGTAEALEVRTWSSQTWFLSGDSTHASLSTDTKNRSESETLRADIQSLTWVQLAFLFLLLHLTPVKPVWPQRCTFRLLCPGETGDIVYVLSYFKDSVAPKLDNAHSYYTITALNQSPSYFEASSILPLIKDTTPECKESPEKPDKKVFHRFKATSLLNFGAALTPVAFLMWQQQNIKTAHLFNFLFFW